MISPSSFFPVNSDTFPMIYVGGGANSKHEQGLGVAASIGSNATWRLRFTLPPVFPGGTLKLRLLALSSAQAGTAKVNPQWVAISAGTSPSGASLFSEGTSDLTWASGDNDKYKELKITLDATSYAVNQVIVMDLIFVTSGWTLAQISCWMPYLIWE
jgi:hypothetical protein